MFACLFFLSFFPLFSPWKSSTSTTRGDQSGRGSFIWPLNSKQEKTQWRHLHASVAWPWSRPKTNAEMKRACLAKRPSFRPLALKREFLWHFQYLGNLKEIAAGGQTLKIIGQCQTPIRLVLLFLYFSFTEKSLDQEEQITCAEYIN